MALIRVREKNPAEGVEPQILEVDEVWLKRWPDDFEEAPAEAGQPQQAAPTEPAAPAKTAPAAAPDGEQNARGRF